MPLDEETKSIIRRRDGEPHGQPGALLSYNGATDSRNRQLALRGAQNPREQA